MYATSLKNTEWQVILVLIKSWNISFLQVTEPTDKTDHFARPFLGSMHRFSDIWLVETVMALIMPFLTVSICF